MINLLLISILTYKVYELNKKVDKNSKIVGNLKIDDLDEEFWDE